MDELKVRVCLYDALEQTYALDYHHRSFYEGGGKTVIGELVYKAKYKRSQKAALDLVPHFLDFVKVHPIMVSADYFVAAPPSNPDKPFDLPTFLVNNLCNTLGIANGTIYVCKAKKTKPMKDISNSQEKVENIQGAFALRANAPFANKTVAV